MKESDHRVLEDLTERLAKGEISGVSTDSRTVTAGQLFVALRGDRFDGREFVPDALRRGAWGALAERPVGDGHKNVFVVDDTLAALQEMALIHRRKFTLPVVGVTGSNGKTTTKEMLASILRQQGPVLANEGNLNNHIGVPLTLLRLERRHRSAVIEMGMSAPGEIALLARLALPSVGVITNIGPAHLQFLGSTDAVARAKGELLQGLDAGGTAVLNADDRYFSVLRAMAPGRTVSFGTAKDADVRAADIVSGRDHTEITIMSTEGTGRVRLNAVGRHNVSNALAAAAAATVLGTPFDAVRSGLEAFRPVALRSELKELRGRTVLADCYNANPASLRAALEALAAMGGARSVAVLGDMLELGDAAVEAHREAGRSAAALGISVLIAVGPLGRHIAEGARAAGMPGDRVFETGTPSQAAAVLRERSREGDVVLIKGSRGMRMEAVLQEF